MRTRARRRPATPRRVGHCLRLSGIGSVRRGGFFHHHRADSRVTDQETGIDRQAGVEAVEVLGETPPRPRSTAGQRSEGHALDYSHHGLDVLVVTRPERCDREAAVAADNCGDAVLDGWTGHGVPQHLGVVVGVNVNEPRSHHPAGGIKHPSGLLGHVAHDHDPPVAHPDVGNPGRTAGPVHHPSALDEQVQQLRLPRAGRPQPSRPPCPRRRPGW